jgi:hypothetical protein
MFDQATGTGRGRLGAYAHAYVLRLDLSNVFSLLQQHLPSPEVELDMEGIPHSYLIYVIHYVLVVKQAILQPDVIIFKGKKSASASWDRIWKTVQLPRCCAGALRTLLEGSFLGFPRGTSTPSSVVLDSAKSGVIDQFVLCCNKSIATICFYISSSKDNTLI